jgi:hypothetical protein
LPSKHTVITSFTQEGYDLYGKTFLETMLKHFVRPVVYWEGPPCDFDTELAEWRTVTEVTGHDWWMEMIAPFPLMKGATGAGYSINYDARMVRKPFMQAHTIKERGGKRASLTKCCPTTSSVATWAGTSFTPRAGS